MNVLVVSPHPDDEVLSCGGTIRRLSREGHRCTVAVVTRGWSPLFPEAQVEQVRAEARRAAEALGVSDLRFLDLPVVRVAELPAHEVNTVFDRLMADVRPDWVFLPFPWDRHGDHRRIYEAAMVALRPSPGRQVARRILCGETLSETHWHGPGAEPPFDPQVHIDISGDLDAKLAAMRCYASQLRPPPHARSLEAIEALARFRGANVGVAAAEAFVLVRDIV